MLMSGDLIVHVVDDDDALRDSIAFLLSSADLTARTYASAQALLDCVADIEPGCIITDIRMPGMNGLELVEELKRRGVGLPAIVLTGHADVGLAVAAMKAGVADFLEKPINDEALLRSVQQALEIGTERLHTQKQREEVGKRIEQLTPREYEVFEAVVKGLSNKEAALQLGISPRTVEIYRGNVMDKMQARTLSDLVRMSLLRRD
jgi:two-component system, LuxR family, response regulator FixJ